MTGLGCSAMAAVAHEVELYHTSQQYRLFVESVSIHERGIGDVDSWGPPIDVLGFLDAVESTGAQIGVDGVVNGSVGEK